MNTTQQELPASRLARRRMPKQPRARSTVDSILQATEELVRAHGFANVGTSHIAARAGVNIGSLYQYFPTYESVLLAWYESVAARVALEMKVAMLNVIHETLEKSIPPMMGLLLKALEDNALVLVHMADEVPEIRQATRVASFEMLIRSSMRMYFNQHHEFEPKDLEGHVFFLESIIFGSMQRYVKEGSTHSIPRAEFLARLSRIMIAYLASDLNSPPC